MSITASERRRHIKSVAIVSTGNFLEMYDFMVFGYYAVYIGNTFFPRQSEFASLMLSLATFGAGFLMRPVGAVVLGAYTDHHGRRAGLLLSLALMALGTATIVFTPGYARIGLVAPAIVVVGRLLQGISAGVQAGGVSVYLSEIAPPGHKGFYVAWQSASQQAAVILAALLGVMLTSVLGPAEMSSWGWRVPFAVGCLLIPFVLLIRGAFEETPDFQSRHRPPTTPEILRSLVANWRLISIGFLIATMTTVSFYLITAYTPTFGSVVLKLTATDALVATLCVGVANFILLPVMGALTDRIGRRPQLFVCAGLALLTGYPVLAWLIAQPSFTRLLIVELWLAVVYAGYNGAMVVYVTEIMPRDIRTSGFSLAYSVATGVFGGFTPAICTYLIHATGNGAMPGAWLGFAATCGLVATLVSTLSSRRQTPAEASVPAPA